MDANFEHFIPLYSILPETVLVTHIGKLRKFNLSCDKNATCPILMHSAIFVNFDPK